uniref:Venom S1 protease with CUB domain 3 n=1 Tax=Platymeris rhadamanthus TaxID=1134088 RepID=A0A6B9KZJ1_PLARH|nr:venom S1 protease with CUB domain 3 [Platymeris rhadamanthus]
MIAIPLLIALGSTLCASQQVQNIALTGEEYNLETPDYPNQAPAGTDLIWNFSVEPQLKISLKCFDLSTARPDQWYPCGSLSIMRVDDGTGEQILCGRYSGYHKLTSGPRLTIKFQSGQTSSGRFSCKLRANIKNKVETKDIHLGDKVEHIYGSADRFTELTWNIINSEPGTKIKLKCGSLYTYENKPCSTDKVIIEEVRSIKEFCGSKQYYTDTDSNWVTIKLFTEDYPGSVSCYAAKIRPVRNEEIHLQLGGPAYVDIIKGNTPYYNKTWTFTTTPDARIALSCPDLRYGAYKQCGDDYYAVDDGTGEKIGCSSEDDKVVFSRGQRLTFRVQSGPYGSGVIHCIAQAVNGPYPDHYHNIVSTEVDSSEHGRGNGPKKTSCRCGWANKAPQTTARILHGFEAQPNEYPWMVAIRDSDKFYYCGGSIITHWHVLTATHCLIGRDHIDLFAVIGEHDITTDDDMKSAKVIKIAKRIYASGYSNTSFTNDIAVALLSEKIEYNNNIGPICLTPNRLYLDNKYILSMGWGTTHVKYQSATLQKAYVRVVDINVCDAKYRWAFKKNGNYHKVCFHSKTRDTCSGDSGGPLVWLDPDTNTYTQISLVSFSHACGYKTPSVSTEVAYFYNWIQSVIRSTYPQEVTCIKV